ncbi:MULTISPECIES: sugar ABC transporter substrate-binding protein [Aliivibrio]|uniref:Extracellular solute-binding protein n=1 Tax=Aliivibrio finisterrensis TaxID=511998 RepID=A0A4Q5KW56_9GAMM|nr:MULTISPECIES: extracellular solute-binding protein [Aliivibrio]MDD9179372.1 extracellular solute-binding protein [Aliivibrio sp. A6]RYU51365.1 extracellular solute-binding protein [Aliivibrio finisterrensis]RYU52545.1 extracellular solute-binding protein [Aliivibrio finisterrensis]RYU58075.1 extracellular solute-binding protein [Aliivibrio finisterrensis]RYU64563.1 extracellular solute-binding protein [Aliivibrio finisterrensis]
MPKLLILISFLFSFSSQAGILEFWSAFGDNVDQKLAKEFEARTGNQLMIRKFSIDEMKAELLLASRSKNYMPDVAWVPSDFLGLHKFIGITPIPKVWIKQDQLEPAAKQSAMVGDSYMGLPLFLGNHLMLFYDKSKITTPITTWEQLQVLSEKEPDKIHISYSVKDMYFFSAFFSLFHPNIPLDQLHFDDEKCSEALTFYYNLAQLNHLNNECNSLCSRQLFIDHKASYLIDGDWAVSNLIEEFGSNLGITSLPSYQGIPMQSLSGGKVLTMTKTSFQDPQKRVMIKQLMQLAQDKEFLTRLINEHQYISASTEVNQTVIVPNKKIMNAVYQQYLQSQPMPTSLRVSFVWEALARGASRHSDGMPANETMEYIKNIIDRFTTKVEGL